MLKNLNLKSAFGHVCGRFAHFSSGEEGSAQLEDTVAKLSLLKQLSLAAAANSKQAELFRLLHYN